MSKEYNPLDVEEINAQREEAELKNRQKAEQDIADFKWLMSSRQGRRQVWRQLEKAGVFLPNFSESHAEMAFREGLRNSGLRLLAMVTAHCSELYMVMHAENTEKTNELVHD